VKEAAEKEEGAGREVKAASAKKKTVPAETQRWLKMPECG
jgi:hypothetical protein